MSSNKGLYNRTILSIKNAKHIKEGCKLFQGGVLQFLLLPAFKTPCTVFFMELITIYNYVIIFAIICLMSFSPLCCSFNEDRNCFHFSYFIPPVLSRLYECGGTLEPLHRSVSAGLMSQKLH